MIKALFLIFEPGEAWGRVVEARRSPRLICMFYLLPMMLIVAAVEGFGLVEWGRWQSGMGGIKKFTPGEAVIFEIMQLLLMAVIIVVCAYFIKALGETFHGKHTYTQTFTVVIYGLSPMFLIRLLDVIPTINLWVPWVFGLLFCVQILYHGVPRVMQPDPPHAFGLYFMSCLLLALTTGVERFITTGYLGGSFKPASDFISHLAARLPF